MKTKSHTTSRIHKFLCSFFFALSSLFFLLCSFFATAQDYEWDWAVSGGGMAGPTGHQTNSEKIYDMKVGSDNNYYFIGTMYGTIGTQLDGEPVTTYNSSGGGNDIFLFSTTCDGTVRWSQAIGGKGLMDWAFNLVLDSDNNVYVGAHVEGGSTYSVYFSPTVSIGPFPADTEAYKRIFLVKYNSDGEYQGRKALQGNVNNSNNDAQLLDLFIDDNDILHFITGLRPGTHLDNNVSVPNTITTAQYFLAKYDTNLHYISSMLLPIADGTAFPSGIATRFAYDQTLNRYYLTGMRSMSVTGSELIPLIYDGKAFVERSYILAFNGTDGSEEWRREIYSEPASPTLYASNQFNSLKIDSNSNIYIGGSVRKSSNEVNLKIYDPYDPSTAYFFTPGAAYGNLPLLIKFDNSGNVQWLQATTAYNANTLVPGPRYGSGVVIRDNEVGLGAQAANEFWDGFEIQRPVSHHPDPVFIRFDKQTGAVIGLHEIQGSPSENQRLTAVAVDNDGNYIVGGAFSGGLFINSDSSVPPVYSVGQDDFFVAKLAASACGTPVVSTKDFNALKLSAYPNPTTAIVNIETDKMLLSYIVYDVSGRQVQSGMFSNNNQINLQNENNGVYFIKITTLLGKSTTLKVIKK